VIVQAEQLGKQVASPDGPLTILADVDLAIRRGESVAIVGVSGSERTITPAWDPTKLDEARVRQMLAEAGHPVRP